MKNSSKVSVRSCRSYSSAFGYSLVELLVVMAVIVLVGTLSWAGFMGMRRTMMVYQSAHNFRSNLVYAQRASMLIERGRGDQWVYGIGIDLTDIMDGNDTYSLFRWCSPSMSYVDFDDVDPAVAGDTARDLAKDANEPKNEIHTDGCNSVDGSAVEKLDAIDSKFKIAGKIEGVEMCADKKGGDDELGYVVFEAVTGKVHFYTRDRAYMTGVNEAFIQFYQLGRKTTVVIKSTGEISVYGSDDSESGGYSCL